MAFKKPKSDEMDMTETTEWAEDVVKEHGRYIPVITGIPKGNETCDLHVRVPRSLVTLCESLAYKKSSCFKTPTDAHRAAYYIGAMLLYCMHGDKNPSELSRGPETYQMLKKTEKYLIINERVENILRFCQEAHKRAELGLMEWEELDKEIADVISQVSSNLQPIIKAKIKQLFAGKSVSDLSEFRHRGRPKLCVDD